MNFSCAITRVSLTVALSATALACWTAQAKVAPSPIRKMCPDGIALQASAATAVQGSLLLVKVQGKKALPAVESEWDGKAISLWQEGADATTLHGLLGIDLEQHPAPYEWKVSWTGADGAEQSCGVSLAVRAGKFPRSA